MSLNSSIPHRLLLSFKTTKYEILFCDLPISGFTGSRFQCDYFCLYFCLYFIIFWFTWFTCFCLPTARVFQHHYCASCMQSASERNCNPLSIRVIICFCFFIFRARQDFQALKDPRVRPDHW